MPGADDGLESSDRNLSTDTLRPRHVVYASSQPSSSSTLMVDNTMHDRASTRFSAALMDPFSDTTPVADSDRNDIFKSAKTNDTDAEDDYDPYSEYKGYNYTPGYTVVPHADAAPSYSTPNPDLRADSFWSSISFFPRTPISASTPPGTHRHGQITKRKRRLHIFNSYEPPPFQHLLLHAVLCSFAYPWLYLTCLAATGRTLNWSRVVVGIGCGTIGFILGLSLLQFARRQMWACTWATVMHESRGREGGGVNLRELDLRTMDAASSYAAVQLLIARLTGASTSRPARKAYDSRHWTPHLLLFLLLTTLTGSITFLFGRIVFIDTFTVHQLHRSEDVSVFADLDAQDLDGANRSLDAFRNFRLTWTFSSFGGAIWSTPSPTALFYEPENTTVFFDQAYPAQMRADGIALGGVVFRGDNTHMPDSWIGFKRDRDKKEKAEEAVGSLVLFTKWGIRIACSTFPEPEKYIIPTTPTRSTYLLVTRSLIAPLFARLNKSVDIDGADLLRPLNRTRDIEPADDAFVPSTLQESGGEADVILATRFADNGVTHTFSSRPGNRGDSGSGWTQLELTLVRLNTTYAPNGSFAHTVPLEARPGEPPSPNPDERLGIDAAICIETFEPWVVEVFNATAGGLPVTRRIVRRGRSVLDGEESEDGGEGTEQEAVVPVRVETVDIKGKKVVDIVDAGTWLSSKDKFDAFEDAHQNAVNQMLKDNAQDALYVPSPTVISFTNGTGYDGYTRLDPRILANIRASSDSSNFLPFLAGSRPLLAKRYPDEVRADARVSTPFAAAILALVFLVGVAAGLFVPKLPTSQSGAEVPQRGFGLYAWLAVLQGDGVWKQVERELRPDEAGLQPLLSEDEVDERLGNVKIRYSP